MHRMAGARQHTLPRFLLKGFASRLKGEEVFTWVYRKGAIPFEANILKVGVEKHFYGKEGEISVDDEITRLEGDYAQLLSELRGLDNRSAVSDPRVAEFVAHLTARTKHLRDSFRESIEYLLDEMHSYLSNFNNLKKLLLSDPDLLREELEKALDQYPVTEQQKAIARKRAPQMLPAFLNTQKDDLGGLVETYMAAIREVMPRAMKEGHIKSLAKNLIPPTRAGDYGRMRWFVRRTERPIILGDCGCLFETGGARRFTPLDDKDDDLVNIYLPISSDRVLIGTRYSTAQPMNVKVINKAIAKCSREFFVCSESSADKASLQLSLGAWAALFTDEQREQLIRETLRAGKASS